MKSVLIIEDDLTLSLMLKTWLSKKKFQVETALSVADAKKKIAEFNPNIVLSDLRLPDESGISLLKWIKEKYPEIVVIMMTGYADIQTAVESIKSGAFDYISKPFNPEVLFSKINEAFVVQKEAPKEKNTSSSSQLVANFGEYVKGTSPAYNKLYEYIDLVAPTKLSVLIKGASGVGKEHVARLIHEKSERSSGPFVAVDCGVLSKELAASDFFGHVKGAFTGAIGNKTGYFLTADKGTLFLDEIGNLSMDIQIQLLRVLQEKKFKPVGSEKEIPVDVRIIAATNEDLGFAVANGFFRVDLYHRISEFLLSVPTLAESKEDVPSYLYHFLEISNGELNKKITGFSQEALDLLVNYSWPGNIRELKNIISRLTLIAQGAQITPDLIPDYIRKQELIENYAVRTSDENEKERIEDALRFSNNDKTKAAALLNIDKKTLFNKLKIYGIVS